MIVIKTQITYFPDSQQLTQSWNREHQRTELGFKEIPTGWNNESREIKTERGSVWVPVVGSV